MKTLRDVLLYLARHAPASHLELAAMEQIIGEHFGGTPAPADAPADAPAGQPEQQEQQGS